MKVLVQFALAAELGDDLDIAEFTNAMEESVAREIGKSIATALFRAGKTYDDISDDFEWYGISVMPSRNLETLLQDRP